MCRGAFELIMDRRDIGYILIYNNEFDKLPVDDFKAYTSCIKPGNTVSIKCNQRTVTKYSTKEKNDLQFGLFLNTFACTCDINKLIDIKTSSYIGSNSKIFEIEILTDQKYKINDKYIPLFFDVLREVPIEEHKLWKLDKKGNISYMKTTECEFIYEYFDTGKRIYFRKNPDTECRLYSEQIWDAKNRFVSSKHITNLDEKRYFIETSEYFDNETGTKCISRQDGIVIEVEEFDKNEKPIHTKEYDPDTGKIICEHEYRYDDIGRVLYHKIIDYNKDSEDIYKYHHIYDDFKNKELIIEKNSLVKEGTVSDIPICTCIERDSKGRTIHYSIDDNNTLNSYYESTTYFSDDPDDYEKIIKRSGGNDICASKTVSFVSKLDEIKKIVRCKIYDSLMFNYESFTLNKNGELIAYENPDIQFNITI